MFMTAALIAVAVAAVGPSSCRKGYSGEMAPIAVGMESTAVNSLIYIAAGRGYFSENGLDVTLKDSYPSGSAAVAGMLKGEVDVATAAELAIVTQAFARQEVLTFGSIDRFMHQYLIGRKDRGISDVSDLKGKRIGAPLKTGAQFNLDRFLDLNRIDKTQVTLIDVQAPQAVAALMEGDLDAVVAWQPNVMALKERLGEQASIWSIHNDQPTYCALTTTRAWAAAHADLMVRFLQSLAQAEDYLNRHPVEAKALVQKRLKYDDEYIAAIWPEHQFSLTLDQSLILAMEDQARWTIANNLTTERQVPDFLDYIYEDALKSVKPRAVNIIR